MFMKENKYFTQTNFWLPVIYILVLGIFFTEDSSFTKVLHYDQDSETKGVCSRSHLIPFLYLSLSYFYFDLQDGWFF